MSSGSGIKTSGPVRIAGRRGYQICRSRNSSRRCTRSLGIWMTLVAAWPVAGDTLSWTVSRRRRPIRKSGKVSLGNRAEEYVASLHVGERQRSHSSVASSGVGLNQARAKRRHNHGYCQQERPVSDLFSVIHSFPAPFTNDLKIGNYQKRRRQNCSMWPL